MMPMAVSISSSATSRATSATWGTTTSVAPQAAPTTDAPDPTTTTGGHTGTTAPSGPARELELVDCDSAPAEVEIVCEAFDLINEQYVDEVPAEELADAARLGLATLDGNDSDQLLVAQK